MKKYCYLLLVVFTSLLSVGCKDNDWSDETVDYEKASIDLRNKQAHFIPRTNFHFWFNSLFPRAYIQEDSEGIRQAIVMSNSDPSFIVYWTVRCDKKQFVRHVGDTSRTARIVTPKHGNQDHAVIANICLLPSFPALSGNFQKLFKQ